MNEKGPPVEPGRRPRPIFSPWLIAAVLAVLLAAGFWAYFRYLRPEPEELPPMPQPPPAPVEEPATAEPAGREREIELPPLGESDAPVRRLVGELSSHPQLGRWLATEALVRRFVAAVDNVARGESPRSHLLFLDPGEGFQVERRDRELVIDPEGYERYDTFAAVVASLDTGGAAELYRELEPLFDQAYRELGYPGGDFDRAFARAIDEILATPVVEEPPELRRRVTTYQLRDPELEELDPVQKQLLRMGPENTRRIQAKLRAIRAELGLGG